MGCKRVRLANGRAITGVLVSSGFSLACTIRFTLPLGKAITIGARAQAQQRRIPVAPNDHHARTESVTALARPGLIAHRGWPEQSLGDLGIECARYASRAGFTERGRRRTRQDQISREAWRPGEIAELGRSAPNEENLFLLPDRFSIKRLSPSKGRSSRLT